MSWLDRLIGRKSDAMDSDPRGQQLHEILSGGMGVAKSGAKVNSATAFRVSVVFACLRVLSEGVAQVPWKVMRTGTSSVSRHSERQDATAHPLYDLLHRRPNEWQTSFEFREQMVIHAALCGTAYAWKNRVQVGTRPPQIAELILLDPGRMRVEQQEDWSIRYWAMSKAGQEREIPADDLWVIRGPSWNGVKGIDVLRQAREAIGLALSTEETQARLHSKGVRPSGVYSVEGTLDAKQYKQLQDWIRSEFSGAERTGVPMILDRNAKWTSQSMTSVDAQHLETRAHQVAEICRFFRVLPLMVGHSDKTQTFASAEQMFLAHVVHTLMPWYERIQQSADVNLLTREERQEGHYTKLVEAGLLRGAMKDTAEYLYRLTLGGIMERNEARSKLDLNPLAGLDEPLTPTNMTTDPSGAPAPGGSNA